jgi:hypothetical protein
MFFLCSKWAKNSGQPQRHRVCPVQEREGRRDRRPDHGRLHTGREPAQVSRFGQSWFKNKFNKFKFRNLRQF